MVIIMQKGATEAQIGSVQKYLSSRGIRVERMDGQQQTVFGIIGGSQGIDLSSLSSKEGVQDVIKVSSPYKHTSRIVHPEDTVITFPDGIKIGGNNPSVVIAGPCSVESEDQLRRTAEQVRKNGVRFMRGGAFKPRTSPYSFQGLGFDALDLLKKVSEEFGLYIVTEVMEPAHVPAIAEFADIIQVGARHMQNFPLLRQLGNIRKPVLLKRGPANTIEEWLMAAEYILAGGNDKVILCERGIRTFETACRYTTDISAVPVVKRLSHLPIIVDPSHGTGKREYINAMARASIAVGADGLMVEVHPDPDRALSDGAQSLTFELFEEMMGELVRIGDAIDRPLLVEPYSPIGSAIPVSQKTT
ncbi:MAG TPA: 3-deoxy-7-phosphoheptulonate synthase [Candidatus Kapabacteria bacterium]|nr:3-deoxy-7-phosphoheptulonate synthase [Candidatus Kapabacteria bacterium]